MTRRCPTSGCGSLTALVDATAARSNTWIRVQPAGRPDEARWYCTGPCAAVALADPGESRRIADLERRAGSAEDAMAAWEAEAERLRQQLAELVDADRQAAAEASGVAR